MSIFLKNKFLIFPLLIIFVIGLVSIYFYLQKQAEVQARQEVIEGCQAEVKSLQEAKDEVYSNVLYYLYSDEKEVLSPNGQLSVFVRNYPRRKADYECYDNEIWLRDNTNGEEKMLVSSKDIIKEKTNSSDDVPFDVFCTLMSPKFSLDGKNVYFNSYAWVTDHAIFSADISTGVFKFISAGGPVDVITKGVYKGKLFTSKHKYYEEGGSYDDWYIIDENNGREIKDVGDPAGNDDAWNKLKEEYGLLNLQ